MDNWSMLKICEVCNSHLKGPILDLGSHPLCDDLVQGGPEVKVPVFHQEIQLCSICLTAHQLHQVDKQYLFKKSYHYRSALTKDVLSGMEDLVESVGQNIKLRSDMTILDIGCNDGSLLGIFKSKHSVRTIGVDPTDAILDGNGRIDVPIQNYFTPALAQEILEKYGKPDVITFTNVFAHIEDLKSLLDAVAMLCSDSTILVIENHYLGSILKSNQFDTFYHEHPRTYSVESFKHIADSLGMEIVSLQFPRRYGGNIRIMLKIDSEASENTISFPREDDFVLQFEQMQRVFDDWKLAAKRIVKSLSDEGPIYGKSLPGRAVMLINSLEIDADVMPRLFEQDNSPKVGYLIPGTSIEIGKDSELAALKPTRLIVWSWHIVEEICNYLQLAGYRGEVWVPLPEFSLYKTIK
jgi:Methyltransferase domain/C-methyltransferase C-terminal domain/Putative zinc binding domain